MHDDTDLADFAQEDKQSKRARFKDAFTRTKSVFRRDEKEKDFVLSQDVNDFLAVGKNHPQTAIADEDRLQFNPPPTSPGRKLGAQHMGQQTSPRGVPMPRLDMSQSTRFPGARPLDNTNAAANQNLLMPTGGERGRSQSFNSMKKRRPKPRNLSVSFDNRPPVIIGEGGDEALQPVLEISRTRQRSRSLSPAPLVQRPGSSHSHSSRGSVSSVKRKPLPTLSSQVNVQKEEDFVPKPLHRVQTGFESIKSPVNEEYELSLQGTKSQSDKVEGNFKTPLVAPKPIHPPVQPPQIPPPPNAMPTKPFTQPYHGEVPQTLHAPIQPPRRESPVLPQQLVHQIPPNDHIKHGGVRVMLTDDNLPSRQPPVSRVKPPPPPPPPRRNPVVPVMPHQQVAHRSKPSLKETDTMGQGAEGWL